MSIVYFYVYLFSVIKFKYALTNSWLNLIKTNRIYLNNIKVNTLDGIEQTSSKLNKLTIKNGRLISIDQLKHLKNLFHLDLSQNEIKDLSSLCYLIKLNSLNLDKNKIANIACLSKLNQLKELYLNENLISDISSLSTLNNLEKLEMNSNQIRNTDIFSKYSFDRLTFLKMDNNLIDSYDHINHLKNLIHVDLKHNELNLLDNEEERVNRLSRCDFSFNEIKSIESFRYSSLLSHLTMNWNQVENIDALRSCKNLQSIQFSHNTIENIGVVSRLKELSWIELSHNQIDTIPNLQNNKNVSYLDLSFNKIKHFNSDICGLTKLTSLILRQNLIELVECPNNGLTMFTELIYLDLAFNRLKSINIFELNTYSYLTLIDLEANQLEQNFINTNCCQSLKILKLNDNKKMRLTNISFLIDSFQSLQELDLSNLNLTQNRLNMEKNCNLMVLKLRNINLERIEFSKCHANLLYLDLSSNKLTTIASIDYLHNLISIDLRNYIHIERLTLENSLFKLEKIKISYLPHLYEKLKLPRLTSRLHKLKQFSDYTYYKAIFLNTPDYYNNYYYYYYFCDLTLKYLKIGVHFNLFTDRQVEFFLSNCKHLI